MADTLAPAQRPARLTMSADQIARRILILRASPSASARMCADDATRMLCEWEAETPWTYGTSEHLPQSYLESASSWVDQGRAHHVGFALPEGW